MHHLHVDNIKWETILYNKMRKKPSPIQPDDIQLAKGEKKLFPYCRTWQQPFCAINVPADGKVMVNIWVERTSQRTYCQCQRYTKKITFWLDLTHISTSLWLRCRIFRPCLWLERRSPAKSFECPINQIPYTHQLNFSQNFKVSHPKSI